MMSPLPIYPDCSTSRGSTRITPPIMPLSMPMMTMGGCRLADDILFPLIIALFIIFNKWRKRVRIMRPPSWRGSCPHIVSKDSSMKREKENRLPIPSPTYIRKLSLGKKLPNLHPKPKTKSRSKSSKNNQSLSRRKNKIKQKSK